MVHVHCKQKTPQLHEASVHLKETSVANQRNVRTAKKDAHSVVRCRRMKASHLPPAQCPRGRASGTTTNFALQFSFVMAKKRGGYVSKPVVEVLKMTTLMFHIGAYLAGTWSRGKLARNAATSRSQMTCRHNIRMRISVKESNRP